MDEINQQIAEAQRAQALAREAAREAEREAEIASRAARPLPDRPLPEGTGPLELERKQGQWRYTLAGQRVRVGDAIELYVDERLGWVRGTFQWGRRNTSSPTLRLPIHRPDAPEIEIGEVEISMPESAVFRWPGAGR